MAPLLVPVLLKPEWYRHLVMLANGQLSVAATFSRYCSCKPCTIVSLPDCSLSVAGNTIAFCQLILQALYYRLVAKVSDLYNALVYLETSKGTQASFTLTAMLIEHMQASTTFITPNAGYAPHATTLVPPIDQVPRNDTKSNKIQTNAMKGFHHLPKQNTSHCNDLLEQVAKCCRLTTRIVYITQNIQDPCQTGQ